MLKARRPLYCHLEPSFWTHARLPCRPRHAGAQAKSMGSVGSTCRTVPVIVGDTGCLGGTARRALVQEVERRETSIAPKGEMPQGAASRGSSSPRRLSRVGVWGAWRRRVGRWVRPRLSLGVAGPSGAVCRPGADVPHCRPVDRRPLQ